MSEPEPELVSWGVYRRASAGMYDFRVYRANFGKPYTYNISAKLGGVVHRLVTFTTSAPLTNTLRDTCINLVRCAA
jgi:hypothetical protein